MDFAKVVEVGGEGGTDSAPSEKEIYERKAALLRRALADADKMDAQDVKNAASGKESKVEKSEPGGGVPSK